MKTKLTGILSLLALITTLLFLVFFIVDMAGAGPMNTFEQVLAHVSLQTPLWTLSYVNVTLLTVFASALMASLYSLCREISPAWAAVGLVFVPVYCALNLFSYFSQITIVPRLIELGADPQYTAFAKFLLRQLLQSWPDSAVSIFNNTAYGVLGIPSILFGVLLPRLDGRLKLGGWLLILNGAACLIGVVGYAARQPLLSLGSLVGAVFFLAALFPLTWTFIRNQK
jgi:hypothetical protein